MDCVERMWSVCVCAENYCVLKPLPLILLDFCLCHFSFFLSFFCTAQMIIASHKKEKTTTETSSGPWWVSGLGWFSHSWLKNRNETILEIYSLCPWGPTVQRDNCNEASKWAKKRQRKTDRPTTTITTIIGTRIATDAAVASSLHN